MSSTVPRRRKTTTTTTISPACCGRSSVNHVLFALLVILLQRGHIQVKAKCDRDSDYNHGCFYSALDILYDEAAKDALSVLRQTETEPETERISNSDDAPNGISNKDNDMRSEKRELALSSLQSAGDDSKTTLTLRGYKGGRVGDQINQDRAMVLSPFEILSDGDKKEIESKSNHPAVVAQLLAVFDGHGGGGENTAQHAMESLPSLLATKLATIVLDRGAGELQQTVAVNASAERKVVEALKQAFDEVDKQDPSRGTAGCTATVILRLDEKLYIANAGDSVSFVGVYFGGSSNSSSSSTSTSTSTTLSHQNSNIRIVYQSREDKPDLPEEKARITAAGGYVHIPNTANGDVPRAYYIDQNRKARYGLAMSRSLGDWKVPGVIAEPIVDVLDLSEIVQKEVFSCNGEDTDTAANPDTTEEKTNQYCDFIDSSYVHIFAVSISDGMMDYLTPEFIGNSLAGAFFDKDKKVHPHTAAEKLIIDAAKGWEDEFRGGYRDDIAIASLAVPFQR